MANVILVSAAAYAAIGLAIGAAFAFRGVGRVDAAAHDAPWGFRLLIWPGSAALWPYVALRWARAKARP